MGTKAAAALVAVVAACGLTGTAQAAPRAVDAYGRVALAFEQNRGQSDPQVEFLSRGPGYAIFATRREVVLALGRPSAGEAAVLRMRPIGASRRARPTARGGLGRRVNYLGAGTRTAVPSYSRVVYRGIYAGVDLVLRGNQRALEYDFVLSPGADPKVIQLAFDGAESLSVASGGALVIETGAGAVRQPKPVVYQRRAGRREPIPGQFVISGKRVGFEIGAYDRRRPLVIDPVIEYATYLGGATSYDQAQALAVDEAGAAYVAGLTFAADYPTTGGVFDPVGHGGGACAPAENPGFQPPPAEACRSDAFVTKLSPDGAGLVYSTFIGGRGSDRIQDIAVDARGAAYVTGGTDSADFPTTAGAVDQAAAGGRRVMGAGLVVLGESFLAKLDPDGSGLEYSTLLGGGDAEEGMGVRVDASGHAYVTGHTFSADFPTTAGAFDTGLNTPGAPPNACSDIFVTKVDAAGRTLGYSTLVGGSRLDFGWGLDLDGAGAAYVLGESTADDAPTTPGALQPQGHMRSGPESADCSEPLGQFDDADPLIVKVEPDGSALAYSTYLGGSAHEHALGIAVRGGAAYVVGHTNSADFPTTEGAFDREPNSTAKLFDGFAAKIAPAGDRLEYSTLLGGSEDDWVFDVTVDEGGDAYLTGLSASGDFPTTEDALDRTYAGPGSPFYDAFVTRLAADGSQLLYSSYFGGAGPDVGLGVARDAEGSVYLAGVTYSPDLPVTRGSFGPVFKGPAAYSDAFLAKFSGWGGPAAWSAGTRQPAMRLSVKPTSMRAGRRVRFRFRATAVVGGRRRAVRGALVRLGTRRARTGRGGRATIVTAPRRPGRLRATARKRGFRSARTVVVVRRAG